MRMRVGCECLLLLAALTVVPATRGAEQSATPPPDEAATQALQSLEQMVARGEVGWWKSQADPGIQFLSKYSGLGGDAVTVLTLNQAEQLWPAWKGVAPGLERFGIACSVYSCLKSANDGNYNAAALNALKDFLKYRLSKMGDSLAASAAGVGLIDFALNSFGEAALQQIGDDYWVIYCRYQLQRHPNLSEYVRLITEGDGTQRGFQAVVASLDSFWDDPATDGIRGFSALKTQDPEYRTTFHNRYLKENLLPFLLAWAERERQKEEAAAWVTLRRLTEQVESTKVTVEFDLLEKGLNEPPTGAVLELAVEFYYPVHEIRVLAQGPVGRPTRLQFPLAAALDAGRKLPTSLKIRLRPTAAAGAQTGGDRSFDVAWTDPSGHWRRRAKPGELIYAAKTPLFVSTWSECPVTVSGPGADKVSSLTFRRLPVGTAANLHELTTSPGGSRVDIRAGSGKIRLEHGVYLITCENEDVVFTHGPISIAGPATVSVPARKAAEAVPTPPEVATLRALVGQGLKAVRERAGTQRDTIATASKSLQEYWLASYHSVNASLATARALQAQLEAELRQPALTAEQQQAIRGRYEPRINELEQARSAAERAERDASNEAANLAQEAADAARRRHDAARQELSAARDALEAGLSVVRQSFGPVSAEFAGLAGEVVSGRLQSAPCASLDAVIEQLRQSLAKLEADFPALTIATEALAPLQSRYEAAVAVAADIESTEGEVIYFNPTDFGPELATLTQQVEAMKNSGLLDEGRRLVRRAEQLVEKRRDRSRRLTRLREQLEAAAGELALPDATTWRDRTAAFRLRLEALFAHAADAEGPDDTPDYRNLQTEIEAFLRTQVGCCGDLIEGAGQSATAYSRFREVFETVQAQQLWREATPEFWQRLDQIAWTKTRARDQITRDLLVLRRDVERWLTAGGTHRARAERLAALRAEFEAAERRTSSGADVPRLNALAEILRSFPDDLVEAQRRQWLTARTALVRSGEADRWLRAQGRPYVQFVSCNNRDGARAFYWPEKAEREDPQTQSGVPVGLAVTDLHEGDLCLVQESSDGRQWRNLSYYNGQWRSYLRWDAPEVRYRAMLPDGSVTQDLPAFPHFVAPTS